MERNQIVKSKLIHLFPISLKYIQIITFFAVNLVMLYLFSFTTVKNSLYGRNIAREFGSREEQSTVISKEVKMV